MGSAIPFFVQVICMYKEEHNKKNSDVIERAGRVIALTGKPYCTRRCQLLTAPSNAPSPHCPFWPQCAAASGLPASHNSTPTALIASE